MPETDITPCDYIRIPVYLTYQTAEGVRVDKAMFDGQRTIVLRWYTATGEMHEKIAFRPKKWANDRNYYDATRRRWKYE